MINGHPLIGPMERCVPQCAEKQAKIVHGLGQIMPEMNRTELGLEDQLLCKLLLQDI